MTEARPKGMLGSAHRQFNDEGIGDTSGRGAVDIVQTFLRSSTRNLVIEFSVGALHDDSLGR